MKSNDDASAFSATMADDSQSVNRLYKTSLLSFHAPAQSGVQQPQALMLSGGQPGLMAAAFSTVERRRAAQPGALAGSPGAAPIEPPIAPPAQSLRSFYEALASLSQAKRREPITILHLGDDIIAGDRFSGELREHFQSRFGNAGRGLMMPGVFPVHGMKVDRGGQWTLASSAAGSPGSYGVTGLRVSAGSQDAWVRFTSLQGPFDWVEVTFATGPAQGAALVSVDGDVKIVPTATPALDETSIRLNAKAREIMIRPRGDGEIALLSVAAGLNVPGVRYVNLGLPGATAATPEKWNSGFLAKDIEKLRPDLIVLGYGTVEGFQDSLDMGQYETRIQWLAGRIKQLAPQASLIVMGPPDAARLPSFAGSAGAQVCRALNAQETAVYSRMIEREDERLGRWHAPPRLEQVRLALRRTASSSGAYFWDWAKFMGGPCAIHAWSSAKPPLAALDHVTLTSAGTERSARALFNDLMAGYDAYLRELQAEAQAKAQAQAAAAAVAQPSKKVAAKTAQKRKRNSAVAAVANTGK